jgi:hypothetical protein
MSKRFKLDLHTHPIEALKAEMNIKGIRDITVDVAGTIVKAVKAAGLNGIAITETNNFNHGWVAALQVLDHFKNDNIVILPGSEIEFGNQHFLQLYIPEYYRRRIPYFKGKNWFVILAQPGLIQPVDNALFNQVEIDAVEDRSLLGDFSAAAAIAAERKIPTIQASNAYTLGDIGKSCIEVDFA